MSDTAHSTSDGAFPRAIIHKQILEEASTSPDASIEEVATAVSGASIELVERVLDDYGDPGEDSKELDVSGESAESQASSTVPEDVGSEVNDDSREVQVPDLDELTNRQRRTLRAIYHYPKATQKEIAEKIDVTDATVSNRVNGIDGFDWQKREDFVGRLFRNDEMEANGNGREDNPGAAETQPEEIVPKVDKLVDRVDSLENQLPDRPSPPQHVSVNSDLASKMIHACMKSEHITGDEELEVAKVIISLSSPSS